MKLILSRKGFDSSAGGCPSPIFPNGSMFSLPIPDKKSGIKYSELRHDSINIGDLLADLTLQPKKANHFAHLDPDLNFHTYPRLKGWKPVFGQVGSAQSHLNNCKVGEGDIFLFFGLYREVEYCKRNNRWIYKTKSRPKHVIWGWMKVREVIDVNKLDKASLPWLNYHPHLNGNLNPTNKIYVATERMTLSSGIEILGAGVFDKFTSDLQLTCPKSKNLSTWRLPSVFFPDNIDTALSYHKKASRWRIEENEHCTLDSVGRGQEFVLDMDYYPEVFVWLESLLVNSNSANSSESSD